MTLKLLTDPVTQIASWIELPTPLSSGEPDSVILEVSLRPGVTDPVAEQIVRASHELKINGVHRAATGSRFQVEGLNAEQTQQLAKSLLANNVIQHWTIGEITPSFPQEVESSGEVDIIPITKLSDD
ncbi:MAG TPA: phosphoribosylformylglycinamidine synthase subunit PurS, partial [Anaerolineales bacterium]|nr:phosphoribosylformylglycinamidine synthase subunit PurS [Anaerolineales bacterium]